MKGKLTVVALFLVLPGSGQRSLGYFRAGLSLFISDLRKSDDQVVIIPALTFAPGIRVINGKDVNLSLTAPVSIGASSRSDTYLGFDLPVMAELHFISATGNQTKKSLGGMLGGGLAYTYSENYYLSYDNVKVAFSGYRFHGGISFGKDDGGSRVIILASYGRGIKDPRKEIFGISVGMIMGHDY